MRNRSEFRAHSSMKADIERWIKEIRSKETDLLNLIALLSKRIINEGDTTEKNFHIFREEIQDLFSKIEQNIFDLEQVIGEAGGCTLLKDREIAQNALSLASTSISRIEQLQTAFEAYSKLKWIFLKQHGETIGLDQPSNQEVLTLLDQLDKSLVKGKNSFKELLDDLLDVYESSEDLLDKGIA
ncbi:MAG: hypothetical protein ACFFBD_00385 [Candidatus Hodarchaeota archaeon]